ncbi:MAG: mechanosensitive ion channel family protein, partial [Methylococcales bacterium]|nr:mechanosensitive ion channel family protein [Methylococcales bacterium]
PDGDLYITYNKSDKTWRFSNKSINRVKAILTKLSLSTTATPKAAVTAFERAASDYLNGKTYRLEDASKAFDVSFLVQDKQAEKAVELITTLSSILQKIPEQERHYTVTDNKVALKSFPNGIMELSLTKDSGWQFTRSTLDASTLILAEIDLPTRPAITPTNSLPLVTEQAESKTTPLGTETPRKTNINIPATLHSPRATMHTFLRGMNDVLKRDKPDQIKTVLSTLDLSEISPLVQKEVGWNRAQKLYAIMNRTQLVDLDSIPNTSKSKPYRFHTYTEGAIYISKQPDGKWLFSRDSIAVVEDILDGLADNKKIAGGDTSSTDLPFDALIRQSLPESLKAKLFSIELWQWVGLFITVALGVLFDKLVSLLLRRVVIRWQKRQSMAYQELSSDILRPLGLMVMAAIWWACLNLLALPQETLIVLLLGSKFLASLSAVWGAYRLIDIFGAYIMEKASQTESKLDDVLAPLTTKIIKIFITLLGLAFIADNLNLDITSLLAGLGLGGLAFALAAKDVAANLFGSITILWDRPFHVGDWVVIGDAEGTVESIGFRSTRIRTFYNSLLTVPNSGLITAKVDNMGSRRFRRHKFMLSVTYDTSPESIDAFCEGLKEIVYLHPYMRKDYFQICFNQMTAYSLDILVYVFWETPEWSTELRERHRFLNDILRLTKKLGVEFAFPTQTIHLKRGTPQAPRDDSPFSVSMPQSESHELGQAFAKDIVENTTGLDQRPPPVTFRG